MLRLECEYCRKKFSNKRKKKFCSQRCNFDAWRTKNKTHFNKLIRESKSYKNRLIRLKNDKEFADERKRYNRDWCKKNRQRMLKKEKEWLLKNKNKRNVAQQARKIQIPIRQKCEKCKFSVATERHHPNYSEPFNILFLCKKCHNHIHKPWNKQKIHRFL